MLDVVQLGVNFSWHPQPLNCSITDLNVPVEKDDMSAAAAASAAVVLRRLWAPLRPEEQQVVHSARVAPGNRQQLLQPLPRRPTERIEARRLTQPPRLRGWRRSHRVHGFGRGCKNETHRSCAATEHLLRSFTIFPLALTFPLSASYLTLAVSPPNIY